MRRLAMFAAAALVAGMAALPAAAENTGFNFDEWFNNNVINKPDDIPEIFIRYALSAGRTWVYCETRASYVDVPWCNGGSVPLFAVEIALPSKGPRSRAKTDLEIGIEWATATGQTGSGRTGGDGRVIIPAGEFSSPNFAIQIPDDSIAHSCNKLIINLRSLTPDRYKIAPFNVGIDAGGSLVLNYVDDDGANPNNTAC
ncbi:MAG: hypothetical protein OXC62_13865 [Aestuariivita sp.]|nr:hypothetical protein [Aestuariivita sp.]